MVKSGWNKNRAHSATSFVYCRTVWCTLKVKNAHSSALSFQTDVYFSSVYNWIKVDGADCRHCPTCNSVLCAALVDFWMVNISFCCSSIAIFNSHTHPLMSVAIDKPTSILIFVYLWLTCCWIVRHFFWCCFAQFISIFHFVVFITRFETAKL